MDWKTNLRNRNIGAEKYGFRSILTKSYNVVNTDRSILRSRSVPQQGRRSAIDARISGAIALKYGDSAFEGQLTLNFQGAAGQSFGAFNHEGVSLNLTGESNDYVGLAE